MRGLKVSLMFSWAFILLLACMVQAQNEKPQNASPPPPSNSQAPDSASAPAQKTAMPGPNSAPPRSDHVDASALDDTPGESSSKDTEIDLSPPPGDDKAHGRGSSAADDSDVGEFHPFNPHKAAKDIEVGDFYFKVKKNYIAAESRYREALFYKENDATATFKLAVCLDKLSRPDEALTEYQAYLKILPSGPEAPEAKKAIARLKEADANSKPAK